MSWKQSITWGVAQGVAACRVKAPDRGGLRVLMYHSVGSKLDFDPRGLTTISPELFQEHMQALKRYPGAQLVSLPEALGAPASGLKISVTFDDGYRDNLTAAAPVLARLGIPFSVFVATGFLDDASGLYLRRSELKELAKVPGAFIGAHSRSHRPLTTCSNAELREELQGSRAELEDLLGRSVDWMAYPFGNVDRRVRDAAEAAGYRFAVSTRFDINRDDRDPLLLCRTEILGQDSVRTFRQKLHGDWDWYRYRYRDPAA